MMLFLSYIWLMIIIVSSIAADFCDDRQTITACNGEMGVPHFAAMNIDTVVDRSISTEIRRSKTHIDAQLHDLEAFMLFVQRLLSQQHLEEGTLTLFESTFTNYALINLISGKVAKEIEETVWQLRFTTVQTVQGDMKVTQVTSLVNCWLKAAQSISTLAMHCQKLTDLQSKFYDLLSEIVDLLSMLPSEYPNVYTIVKDAISVGLSHTSALTADLQAAATELQRQAELANEIMVEEL